MNKTTESDSHYNGLEDMSVEDILYNINSEDAKVSKKFLKKYLKLVN